MEYRHEHEEVEPVTAVILVVLVGVVLLEMVGGIKVWDFLRGIF